MTSKRSGTKAKSVGGANRGKPKVKLRQWPLLANFPASHERSRIKRDRPTLAPRLRLPPSRSANARKGLLNKGIKKLKLKKETLKDLEVKDKGGMIKGGQKNRYSPAGC